MQHLFEMRNYAWKQTVRVRGKGWEEIRRGWEMREERNFIIYANHYPWHVETMENPTEIPRELVQKFTQHLEAICGWFFFLFHLLWQRSQCGGIESGWEQASVPWRKQNRCPRRQCWCRRACCWRHFAQIARLVILWRWLGRVIIHCVRHFEFFTFHNFVLSNILIKV